nr:MAG TPA: hypothetical protein [Caudoviricetes sp.]
MGFFSFSVFPRKSSTVTPSKLATSASICSGKSRPFASISDK